MNQPSGATAEVVYYNTTSSSQPDPRNIRPENEYGMTTNESYSNSNLSRGGGQTIACHNSGHEYDYIL